MSDTPLHDAIVDAAQAPKKIEGDQGSIEQHALKDLIAADKHLAGKAAVQSKSRGFVLGKLKGPGAVG